MEYWSGGGAGTPLLQYSTTPLLQSSRLLLKHLRQFFFEFQTAILALEVEVDRILGFLQLELILLQINVHHRAVHQMRCAKIVFFEYRLGFFRGHETGEELGQIRMDR